MSNIRSVGRAEDETTVRFNDDWVANGKVSLFRTDLEFPDPTPKLTWNARHCSGTRYDIVEFSVETISDQTSRVVCSGCLNQTAQWNPS
jgi:hypothetical protein